jgi:uncharacterized protein YbaR (Trm112 family)
VLLELSEILACPVCGPPQIMVAVVHESESHRVITGFLGCPACDSRFEIIAGVVHFSPADGTAGPEAMARAPVGPLPEDSATLIAAVLELQRGSGYVLLGPGLEGLAQPVAALAERWEVVSLGRRAAQGTEDLAPLSRLITGESEPLPLLPGRFAAAAMHGYVGVDEIRHVAAALRQVGRLAIVSPGPAAGEAVREAGLGVLAADARVIVAARRAGQAS